jgi:hypothetical protein
MYMNRQVRAAYLMLAGIPQGKRSRVTFYFPQIDYPTTGVKRTVWRPLRLEGVPEGRNFLAAVGNTTTCHLPLADVLDVWEESDGTWAVKVSGTFDSSANVLSYRPRF